MCGAGCLRETVHVQAHVNMVEAPLPVLLSLKVFLAQKTCLPSTWEQEGGRGKCVCILATSVMKTSDCA